VIEVPSSVRLDPPPHPSWPNWRRTDAPVKKRDWRGPLAMSDDELAALFCDSRNVGPLTEEDWKECCRRFCEETERAHNQAEEEYWRSFREEIELIRELRAIHPTEPQLAMSADEITQYYRSRSPGPRTEAQRSADLKIVSRPQPGKKANPNEKRHDKYLALRQECIAASPGNMRSARIKFINEAIRRFGVDRRTAENHWYRLRRDDAK
jgi:hypothetical protein